MKCNSTSHHDCMLMPFPEVMWWHRGRTINPSDAFCICLNQTDRSIVQIWLWATQTQCYRPDTEKAAGIERRDWHDTDICLKVGLLLEDIEIKDLSLLSSNLRLLLRHPKDPWDFLTICLHILYRASHQASGKANSLKGQKHAFNCRRTWKYCCCTGRFRNILQDYEEQSFDNTAAHLLAKISISTNWSSGGLRIIRPGLNVAIQIRTSLPFHIYKCFLFSLWHDTSLPYNRISKKYNKCYCNIFFFLS